MIYYTGLTCIVFKSELEILDLEFSIVRISVAVYVQDIYLKTVYRSGVVNNLTCDVCI